MNNTNETKMDMKQAKQNNTPNIRWTLVGYDLIVYALVAVILLVLYGGMDKLSTVGIFQQVGLSVLCIFTARLIGKIYGQVWRYGGIQCYIRLLFTDSIAFVAYLCLELLLPVQKITFARLLSLVSLNLLGALALRMMYRYAYKCGNQETTRGKILSILLHIFSGIEAGNEKEVQKIKVAIIGAGRVGVSLAEELLNNSEAAYVPRCFIDINKEKVGRDIHGIPVWSETEATFKKLGEFEVQEIIFAIPSMDAAKKKSLYEYYKNAGYKLKVYDYPTMYAAGGKRHLREFDIEELLFRKPLVVSDERTNAYYKDKVVLITGGGGSIGSELCRQLAKMNPKKIIILDIYENGAYDVQQELKIAYGNKLDLQIEICSITHRKALERVFEKYHPQIIINAAAHKHVPLMEHNCVEAIYNNVFGTQNLVELCEEYGAERFMMVSTDKAVNPTNVMGATTIIDICQKERIDGVLSLIDPELSLLAKNENLFEAIGTKVIGSAYDLCEMSLDKYQMYSWLKEHQYKCAKSYMDKMDFYKDVENGKITYPVFVKPARGSASIAISKVYGGAVCARGLSGCSG